MQHSSLSALFNDEEGGCGAYWGGYLCVSVGGGGQFYDSSSELLSDALSLDSKSSHHPLETNNCQVG